MIFTSVTYFAFLTIALLCFYICPKEQRVICLGLFSFAFAISFHWLGAAFLLLSSIFTFFISKIIAKQKSKILLGISIGFLVCVLFGLKYLDDTGLVFNRTTFQLDATIIFIGLSYYTLQNIAFLLNSYWGKIKTPLSFSQLFLFNAFFPKLTSGPIEEYKSFQEQVLKVPDKLIMGDLSYGFQRILVGLFKKVVIADRLAPVVAMVFQEQIPNNGLTVWIGVCLFTLQLYFDFSGLIDIALGSARCFGISLSENFNFPLRSKSLTELWRRWHMSLIDWLTKYLYYPVVYRLRTSSYWGVLVGINLVFLLSGLWHGWGTTYILWAMWNALVLSLELLGKKTFGKSIPKLPFVGAILKVFYCFNVFAFGLLFFRAQSWNQIKALASTLFSSTFFPPSFFYDCLAVLAGGGTQELLFNFYLVLICASIFLLFEKRIYNFYFSTKWRIIGNAFLICAVVVLGVFEYAPQFIYLQF